MRGFGWLARPSPLTLATAELEQAQRELLLAATGAEYADALVVYNQTRIERLRTAIRDLTGEDGEKIPRLGN